MKGMKAAQSTAKDFSCQKSSAAQIIRSVFHKYFCFILYYVHEESRYCTFSALPTATLGAANPSSVLKHSVKGCNKAKKDIAPFFPFAIYFN